MNAKEQFIDIVRHKIGREGIDSLMQWISESDFYTAPASTKYHGSYEGGLVEHSVNVYNEMLRLLKAYPELKIAEESVAIAALFHDLCKVNFYTTEKRNRKNAQGQWESYDAYNINEKFCYGGHGSKSVFIAQHYIALKPEEAVAINCHMGVSDGNQYVSNAYEQYPLAWLLHVADESAAFIIENERMKTDG